MRPEAFFTAEHNYLSQFASANPTVLLAEDQEDARYVLSLELQHRGCRVIEACDGREAVETALIAHPDLILMDLNLPLLDGLAATEQIRAHSELDAVPIIAVTAFDTYGIREAAFEAGCQEYLLKPLGPDALARAIRTALPGFVFEHDEAHDSSNGHD